MILSLALSSVIAGGILAAVGYYTPFMILASILTAVSADLISTLTVNTGHAHWIGYEVIYGLALGGGIQQPINAVQRILEPQDVIMGSSLILFMQTLLQPAPARLVSMDRSLCIRFREPERLQKLAGVRSG
ncbi:hypothetical protein B0H13DRAFT_2458041 [Mycena leptocephala]|nr:hypothetical protein B0H13DRAFT_2458041 [Mycena leptocephala]